MEDRELKEDTKISETRRKVLVKEASWFGHKNRLEKRGV